MPEEYQKELFEQYNKAKSKLEIITDKITRKRKRFFIYVPLENLIVCAIVFIMCLVVAFALGVERGEKIAVSVSSVKLNPIEVSKAVRDKIEPAVAPVVVTQAAATSAYVIQLMSFKNPRDAEKEKNKLINKKIDAFIVRSDGRYKLCVGGYRNAKEAEMALEKFKRDYKGCFIRKGG